MERRERDALLSRRFAPNETTEVVMGDANLHHHDRLAGTGGEIDALIAGGAGILSSLRGQGSTLKVTRVINSSLELGR